MEHQTLTVCRVFRVRRCNPSSIGIVCARVHPIRSRLFIFLKAVVVCTFSAAFFLFSLFLLYLVILYDLERCDLRRSTRDVLHRFSVDLPKKHGRGGQSALRFARLRLEKRHNYVRKVRIRKTVQRRQTECHGVERQFGCVASLRQPFCAEKV